MEMSVEVTICRMSKAPRMFCTTLDERKDDIALFWVIAEMENGKLVLLLPMFTNHSSLITAGA